jgi:hypothetical protein
VDDQRALDRLGGSGRRPSEHEHDVAHGRRVQPNAIAEITRVRDRDVELEAGRAGAGRIVIGHAEATRRYRWGEGV